MGWMVICEVFITCAGTSKILATEHSRHHLSHASASADTFATPAPLLLDVDRCAKLLGTFLGKMYCCSTAETVQESMQTLSSMFMQRNATKIRV